MLVHKCNYFEYSIRYSLYLSNVKMKLLPPNGLRYRRLGRTRLGNGKLPTLRTNSKKRAEFQPSGARCVRRSGDWVIIQPLIFMRRTPYRWLLKSKRTRPESRCPSMLSRSICKLSAWIPKDRLQGHRNNLKRKQQRNHYLSSTSRS